jgi:hypothetical protein
MGSIILLSIITIAFAPMQTHSSELSLESER